MEVSREVSDVPQAYVFVYSQSQIGVHSFFHIGVTQSVQCRWQRHTVKAGDGVYDIGSCK